MQYKRNNEKLKEVKHEDQLNKNNEQNSLCIFILYLIFFNIRTSVDDMSYIEQC